MVMNFTKFEQYKYVENNILLLKCLSYVLKMGSNSVLFYLFKNTNITKKNFEYGGCT